MIVMTTYLVTGGTGFVGSALVRRLARKGNRVRVFDDNSRGATRRLGDVEGGAQFVGGDVRDAGQVREAVRGVDCVIHLAYINGTEFFYERPEVVLDVAVKGMVNILDACMEHGVPEFVLASSSEVYQTPPVVPTPEDVPLSVPDALNPRYSYGGGKIISELMLIHQGRKNFKRAMIFRPHNVYGPDMGYEHVIPQFILRLAEFEEQQRGRSEVLDFPIQGTGQETRAFVHISDLVEGVLCLLERGEHLGIYHIGTEVETTIEELAVSVARCFQREIRVVPGELRAGGPLRRCPDITRMRRLGYDPRIELAVGLPETVEWYRSNIRKPSKTADPEL